MFKRALACGSAAVLLAAVAAGWVSWGRSPEARLLHVEPSRFAPVVVFEQYGERCMNFNEIEAGGRQSCQDLGEPGRLVFEYTRMMAAALLIKPRPQSVLVIGLGGGSLPVALHTLLPEAVIDTVELDPAVVNVARRYFGYETGPRQRVFTEDGRVFVERAAREGRRYGIVMLDAFDTDYIPPHLMTQEFLERVRDILEPDGLVVANSFAQSRLHERESATYAAVFGEFFNLKAGLEGNRVIVASRGDLPDDARIRDNVAALAGRLLPLGVDAAKAAEVFAVSRYLPAGGEPLHDE
jgi:spermidine synthase